MKVTAKIAALEISGDVARAALVKTGAKPRVLSQSVCRARYGDPSERFSARAAAVREALDRLKGKAAAVVLMADASHSVARSLRLPFKGPRRVAAAVRFELEPYLAMPIDELVVDHAVVRTEGGETEVLAAGLRRAIVAEQTQLVEAAGYHVDGVGLDSVGLTLLWHEAQRKLHGLHAMAFVGSSRSVLAVVYNKSLAHYRTLDADAAAARARPDALAREIANSLRAFHSQWSGEEEVASLALTGAEPPPGLTEALEEDLGCAVTHEPLAPRVKGLETVMSVEVEPEAPADEEADRQPEPAPQQPEELTPPEDWTEQEGGGAAAPDAPEDAFVALAGAAQAAAGAPYHLNFSEREAAPGGSMRGLLTHAAFSFALALLLLGGVAAVSYVRAQRNREEVERMGAQIWELYAEAFPDSERVQAGRRANDLGGAFSIDALRSDYEDLSMPAEVFDTEPFGWIGPLELLEALATAMGDRGLTLEEVRLEGGRRPGIEVEGTVPEAKLGALNEAMEELRDGSDLELEPSADVQGEAGQVTFTIEAGR